MSSRPDPRPAARRWSVSARSSRSAVARCGLQAAGHASQSRISRVHVGVVEQAEVVGAADVQHVGAGEQRAPAAVPAVRRGRPDQQVADHVARPGAAAARSGSRRPGGSARAAAAARPRPARRPGRARPADRQSRIRPNAAVSGSRPSPRLPWPMPHAIGAPRCGVPRVTTSLTRSAPRLARPRWPPRRRPG